MGFKKFEFTKEWTDVKSFPAIETDEKKVREDMQVLHDESRKAVHDLIDEMEAATAAMSLGATDQNGESSTVQEELNTVNKALRDHIEIDPSSVRDNNVSVTEEVIERLGLDGVNPTVKDALLWLQALIDQESENLMASIEARAQVVCGTVTGNSKASADSPNSITFPFKPKLVYVTEDGRRLDSAYSSLRYDSFLWVEGVTRDRIDQNYGAKNRCYKLEGNTFSWWVEDTQYSAAVVGSYVAIG